MSPSSHSTTSTSWSILRESGIFGRYPRRSAAKAAQGPRSLYPRTGAYAARSFYSVSSLGVGPLSLAETCRLDCRGLCLIWRRYFQLRGPYCPSEFLLLLWVSRRHGKTWARCWGSFRSASTLSWSEKSQTISAVLGPSRSWNAPLRLFESFFGCRHL